VRFFSSLVFAELAFAELDVRLLVLAAFVPDFPALDARDLDAPDLAAWARRPVLRFRTRFIMAPLT
jgi:hypothetical protein